MFLFIYLRHFIFYAFTKTNQTIYFEQSCFLMVWFLSLWIYKYIYVCMYLFNFSNSHSLSHFFLSFDFQRVVQIKNEIFKGAKTKRSFITWMHQTLKNKIQTLREQMKSSLSVSLTFRIHTHTITFIHLADTPAWCFGSVCMCVCVCLCRSSQSCLWKCFVFTL